MGGAFRIGSSILFAVLLVGGAFVMQRGGTDEVAADNSPTVVMNTPTRQYIQTKDSDGDGIRDWEEELRGTDPLVANDEVPAVPSRNTTTEEDVPYERPTTLTDTFALNFFEDFVTTRQGTRLEPDEQQAFAATAVDSLVSKPHGKFYTRADISLSLVNDFDDIRRYGNAVGSIITSHTVTGENELLILQRAVSAEDATILEELLPVRKAYQGMISEMVGVRVPSSLIDRHLDLLNTLVLVERDIAAFEEAFNDPLLTLTHVKRYQDDATGLFYAVDNVRNALEREGIVYTNDEPGIFFFSLRP